MREKLKKELSSLFYTAKYIGSASPNSTIHSQSSQKNIEKFGKILDNEMSEVTETSENNKVSYSAKQLSARTEEKTRGNIFTTSLSQQITKQVNEHKDPFSETTEPDTIQ